MRAVVVGGYPLCLILRPRLPSHPATILAIFLVNLLRWDYLSPDAAPYVAGSGGAGA
jgi:hypothetical protein